MIKMDTWDEMRCPECDAWFYPEKNIKEEEIAEAIKNLKRANSALSQLFGFEEETDDN